MIDRSSQHIDYSYVEPGILQITFSKEEALNSMDRAMHREVSELWLDVDRDPDTRAVIVTGAGPSFSAGGDLEMVDEIVSDPAVRAQLLKETKDLVHNMINCSKPVVSAIRGHTVGAGLAVALLADIPIASRTARLMDGHTRLGVAAGDHAVIIWPLLCGMAKAKYHLLLSEPIDGVEAERLGLVALCVEDDEVMPRALDVARRLANGSQTALSWTKYALNSWLRMMSPSFDLSVALEFVGFSQPDVHEGLRSIREKRPPRFNGQV